MSCTHSVCSIIPPHILRRLAASPNPAYREAAFNTLLATARLRAERQLIARVGFMANATGVLRRSIYDCRHAAQPESAALARAEGDAAVADKSVNRAYDGFGVTYGFFSNVLHRNSIDDRGMRLDGYVHFRNGYNNAFWDGRRMVFGDGDGRLFKDLTESLDVIAHELTHGVVEATAGLEYHLQPGALNESMADVFGSVVKQWNFKQDVTKADWLIGDTIFTPQVKGDALRSLRAPGTAYNDPDIGKDPQPAHMRDFVNLADTEEDDWGGVHINSGIPNHAFYLAANAIGGNAWGAASAIWYEALKRAGVLTNFVQFAVLTSQAASGLYGAQSRERAAVVDAWRAVGVLDEVPLAAGAADMGDADAKVEYLARRIDVLARQVEVLQGRIEFENHKRKKRA
jgi:Zn-dependent metalloprotease